MIAPDEKSGEVIKIHPEQDMNQFSLQSNFIEMVSVIRVGDKRDLLFPAGFLPENADFLYAITEFLIGLLQVLMCMTKTSDRK